MVDLVGVLENNCNTLGWKFSYGNTANNNLLTSDLDSDLIYFLLDPVRRVKAKSEYGGQGEITFNGNFLLLVQSDMDNVMHTQKDVESTTAFEPRVLEDGGTVEENDCIPLNGKYEKNIEPLLQKLELMENILDCSQYEITGWEIIDTINSQDFNGDGVVVTFSIKTL